MTSPRSIDVPARWWAAFTVYPASPAMRRIMLELARLRWSGDHHDDEVVVTARDLAEPARCGHRTAHLMLRVASTPPPDIVDNGSKTWKGRGLLRRRQLDGTRRHAYQITDPCTWWWPSELEAARGLALAQEAATTPQPVGRGAAVAAAETLWALHDGDHPVLRQSRDPRWPRWVATMEGLLDRGYSLGELQEAMREAATDAFYRERLQRHDADELFAGHFPAFLQRARVRDQSPPPPPPPLVYGTGDRVRLRVDGGPPVEGAVVEILDDGRLRIEVRRRKPPHTLRTVVRRAAFVLPAHGR